MSILCFTLRFTPRKFHFETISEEIHTRKKTAEDESEGIVGKKTQENEIFL